MHANKEKDEKKYPLERVISWKVIEQFKFKLMKEREEVKREEIKFIFSANNILLLIMLLRLIISIKNIKYL